MYRRWSMEVVRFPSHSATTGHGMYRLSLSLCLSHGTAFLLWHDLSAFVMELSAKVKAAAALVRQAEARKLQCLCTNTWLRCIDAASCITIELQNILFLKD